MDLQWKWDKWTNAVISGNELIGATLHMRSEPMGSIEYCPNTIDPPLHHQLKTLFVDYLENHPTDGLITEWLQSFGPLYVTGPYQFRTEEFIQEAGHVWWINSAIVALKNRTNGTRRSARISVPNPLNKILEASYFPAGVQARASGLLENLPTWTTDSSDLASLLHETTHYYLTKNAQTNEKNELQPKNLSGFIWLLIYQDLIHLSE